MCGIAGVAGAANPEGAERAVRTMISVLARRGPDSEGLERWDGAVLGHRRLAIFDLSPTGHQPMLAADRALGVVFNGAIYNHRDLRADLIGLGCRFRSTSDTEVLLHGYREWGIDKLVSRLRGMFAFGLWDDHLRKLYLVRDRLGVKPLVFACSDKTIAFASTVRALRAAGYVANLDPQAVADFLRFGFVTDERAIYQGARKVPAASIIEWQAGTWTSRSYWSAPLAETSTSMSFEDAVEETERLLLSSVQARLEADVPVGSLLSGGIDSALICWAVSRLGSTITAFTVGTPGDPWDETPLARETAGTLGIEHRVLHMSQHDDPGVEDLAAAYAEPFASASALGMLKISQAVSSSAKVLLTGDGGDDAFLGYPRHRHLWLADKMAGVLPASARAVWGATKPWIPRWGPLRRAVALTDYATGDLRAFIGDVDLSAYRATGILGDRLLAFPSQPRRIVTDGRHVLAAFLEHESRHRFVGEYLPKVDGTTMHHGLEARSPFLDQLLWEFAAALPFDIRLHRGRLKAILRELARRRLGPRVAGRRKRGFGVPVQRWIAGRWRPWVEATLRDSILDKDGWIRVDAALAQLTSTDRQGRVPVQLWYIFVLESWLKYEAKSTPDVLTRN